MTYSNVFQLTQPVASTNCCHIAGSYLQSTLSLPPISYLAPGKVTIWLGDNTSATLRPNGHMPPAISESLQALVPSPSRTDAIERALGTVPIGDKNVSTELQHSETSGSAV